MALFKEYIRERILNNEDIVVGIEHLESVTFEDICIVIHYTTKMKNGCVKSTGEIKDHPYYVNMNGNGIIIRGNEKNFEELVILMFAIRDEDFYAYPVSLHDTVNEDGYNPVYNISQQFILNAKDWGIYDYPIVKRIIAAFNMDYEYSLEEADGYMEYYLHGINTKSARNS